MSIQWQGLTVAAVLALSLGASSAVPQPRSAASAAPTAASTPVAAARATQPAARLDPAATSPTSCASCPPGLTPGDVRAVRDAASAVQAAARELSRQDESFWRNVGVNVFSNRVDEWLFGKGTGNQGLAAYAAAWISLVAALIKLALATKMPDRAPGPVRRVVEVTLSVILLVSAALGVLAVHTARSSLEQASASSGDQEAAMATCQQNLRAALAAGGQQPQAELAVGAIQRTEVSCNAARTEAAERFNRLERELTALSDDQLGWGTSLLLLACAAGIGFLILRALERRG